jgi:hypothetical protein
MATRSRRGREYRERVIAKWRLMGRSMLSYAQDRVISYSQLVRWRRRIEADEHAKASVTLIPIGNVAVGSSGSCVGSVANGAFRFLKSALGLRFRAVRNPFATEP